MGPKDCRCDANFPSGYAGAARLRVRQSSAGLRSACDGRVRPLQNPAPIGGSIVVQTAKHIRYVYPARGAGPWSALNIACPRLDICRLSLFACRNMPFRYRPNLCRSAVPLEQRGNVRCWPDLPIDKPQVNGSKVPRRGFRLPAARDQNTPFADRAANDCFNQVWALRRAICVPESSHSFSAINPVSPSPKDNFRKEQSGTDFGNADAPDACRRDRQAHVPTMGSQSGMSAIIAGSAT